MTIAATLALAASATLAVAVASLAVARRSDRSAGRRWIAGLAQAIVVGGLRHLAPEHRDRYREEYEADLAQLGDGPVRMLVHALQTAACARRLVLTLGVAPVRRQDPLLRRALAHLGFPVRLVEPPASADASYVFGGTMRCRRPDGDLPPPLTLD